MNGKQWDVSERAADDSNEDKLNKGFRGFPPDKWNVRKHIRCLLRLCHTRIQED